MTDPRTPTSDRACARYWGSDGTLCATHNGRFATQADMRCDRTPTSDPVAALDAAWEALIADAVGSFNLSSVIRRHRPIIEAEARQQARAAFAAQVAALREAIEHFLGTPRPQSADRDRIKPYELALSRLRVAYGVFAGTVEPCPVPSSVTGQPCLLPAGHPQDSGTRFHRYALLAASPEPASPEAPGSGLDVNYEKMRVARGWPTPNHMRRAAEAIAVFTPAKYGDILRWVADLCDDSLAARPDGAEADAGHSPWRDMTPEQWDKAGRK